MNRALRTVEEIFGKPLPPLTGEQQAQLEQLLVTQIGEIFQGPYHRDGLGERNRAIARRMLLEGATTRQAGQEFGLTSSRIGQLRLKALRLLRQPFLSRPMRVLFREDQ